MKETKYKQTEACQTKDERRETKESTRHCEERSDVAIQGGFKMTEVGLIPNDWEIKPLKDIAGLKAGKMTSYNDFNPKYPCFGGNGIRAYLSHYSHDGIYPIIGRQGELCGNVNLAKGKFYATEHAVVASPKKDIDAIWLYYQLTVLNLNQYATGCAQPGLSVEKINDVYTQVPPTIEEQQRISNALSDVDTLIANLEKFIAKKKNIKQGAMQQLLTGKKRLPGFGLDYGHTDWFTPNGVHEKSIKTAKVVGPESIRVKDKEQCAGFKMTELGLIPTDWEVKKIGDFCKVYDGTHQTPHYVDVGIPFYSVENVSADDFEHTKFISNSEYEFISKRASIEKGDVLMTRIGSIGVCKYVDWDCKSGFYVSLSLLKCNEKIDARYLCQQSKSEAFKKEIELHSLTTAIPQKINLGPISQVRIIVPISKAEQTAIANVLSDMDTEISALETKLAKYRTLKTGMMQQLLTGKIRLV